MLQINPLQNVPLIKPGDDLINITLGSLGDTNLELEDGDILVFAQKIISKTENRFIDLSKIEPSEEALKLAEITGKEPELVEIILQESKSVIRAARDVLVVEHRCGFISANAGIDRSNVEGPFGKTGDWVLLLPEDSDRSAHRIRENIFDLTGTKIGVLIIDSHGRPWRLGTVGVTIGLAGLPGLVDLRQEKDLFGYQLRHTQVAAADELAAAASLMMGQVAEGTPIAHVRGFPYMLREAVLHDLLRPPEKDLFR